MFVEIRNYHYDPSKFEAYRQWALNDAVPFLRANFDVVDFWLDNGEPPELTGKDPMSLKARLGKCHLDHPLGIDESKNRSSQESFPERWLARNMGKAPG